MEMLYNRFDQKEPIVMDAIRESAFFSKMVEGFPATLGAHPNVGETNGLHLNNASITDFYVGLGMLSKLNAALVQSFSICETDCMPENGFASAALEIQFLREVRMLIRESR
jgi:hypothetical protein